MAGWHTGTAAVGASVSDAGSVAQGAAAAAERIAADCLAIPRGGVVVLCWAEHADPLFVPLRDAIGRLGGRVLAQRWSDSSLLSALRRWPPDEVTRLCLPLWERDTVRLAGGRSAAAARVVALLPPWVGEGAQTEARLYGLDDVVTCAFRRLGRAGVRASSAVLLEWPRGPWRDGALALGPAAVSRLFVDAYDQDYERIRQLNARLARRLAGAREVRISCPRGTDLRLRVDGRTWYREDCRAGVGSAPLSLPGGEVYAAAREDSATGRIVTRLGSAIVQLDVRGGLCRAIESDDPRCKAALEAAIGLDGEPLCELGVGTNPAALTHPVGAFYEKARGTIHVAFGANAHFGGIRRSPVHLDLVVPDPDLDVDGRPVLRTGHLVASR